MSIQENGIGSPSNPSPNDGCFFRDERLGLLADPKFMRCLLPHKERRLRAMEGSEK
jgi:hypothetical protein